MNLILRVFIDALKESRMAKVQIEVGDIIRVRVSSYGREYTAQIVEIARQPDDLSHVNDLRVKPLSGLWRWKTWISPHRITGIIERASEKRAKAEAEKLEKMVGIK